jgi:hypothetical protein
MNKEILAPGIVLYRSDKAEVDNIFNQLEPAIGTRWNQAMAVNTETLASEVIESRSCYDYPLSGANAIGHQKDLYDSVDRWIAPKIEDFVSQYSIEKLTAGPYIFLKYKESNKFDWHIDDGNKFPRTVSVSAYINDDYEGGEIEFQHFGISHKPKAGDIIVFGSSFSYLHRVKPVTNGTRYAVVNWYRYDGYPMMMGN